MSTFVLILVNEAIFFYIMAEWARFGLVPKEISVVSYQRFGFKSP
jgi:hypothetical protein